MPLSLLRIGLFSYRSSLAKNYCLVRPFEVSLLCGSLGVCCHLPRVQSDSTALLETSFCYPTTSVFQRLLKRDTGEGTKADHRARTWFNGYVSLKPTKFTATPSPPPLQVKGDEVLPITTTEPGASNRWYENSTFIPSFDEQGRWDIQWTGDDETQLKCSWSELYEMEYLWVAGETILYSGNNNDDDSHVKRVLGYGHWFAKSVSRQLDRMGTGFETGRHSQIRFQMSEHDQLYKSMLQLTMQHEQKEASSSAANSLRRNSKKNCGPFHGGFKG